jgi:hypothetical protein
MFSSTIIGNVSYMELATHEGREFLAITVAVNDAYDRSCRIKFNNSNGLLTAYRNGTFVIGQQIILSQYDVRISSIRTHYTKDDQLIPLKYPEIALTNVRASIGSAPKPKPVVLPGIQVEPTLEEIPF